MDPYHDRRTAWIALLAALPVPLFSLAACALFGLPPARTLLLGVPFAALSVGAAFWSARRCRRAGRAAGRRELERLRERADRDYLTGLASRLSTEEQTTRLLRTRPDGHHLFVMIDLDDFKQANDLYGHLYGDGLLQEAAGRIRRALPEGAVVGRVGGDEFAALLPDLASRERAVERLAGLVYALHEPISGYALSCSVGTAWFPQEGQNYRELFRAADKALYRAKQGGKNCFVFTAFAGKDRPAE